jgi:hypothetical protein
MIYISSKEKTMEGKARKVWKRGKREEGEIEVLTAGISGRPGPGERRIQSRSLNMVCRSSLLEHPHRSLSALPNTL